MHQWLNQLPRSYWQNNHFIFISRILKESWESWRSKNLNGTNRI
jgi:hypothetical protein